MQKAIKEAVGKIRLCKRASAHSFRHSFASLLLQANIDIHIIQVLLGRSDLKSHMIYTYTVKSVTIKDAKSQLDLWWGMVDAQKNEVRVMESFPYRSISSNE